MNETTNKTTSKKVILRTTAAVLVAGVATMLATGSASAATPRTAPRPPAAAARVANVAGPVGTHTIELVNMTPYEWTLNPASIYIADANNKFDAAHWPDALAPTQTLEPGQREDIQTLYDNATYGVMWVSYNFTDAAGGQHSETFQTPSNPSGWGQGVNICAADGTGNASVPSTTFNTVKYNPNSDPVTIAAGMDGPTDVTIDAAKEPARAAAIMQQFATGTDQSYTPTQAVQYTPMAASTPDQVTGEVVNDTSEKAVVRLAHSVETTEDTTLGAEVGAEADFSILGLVNANASVSVQTSKTFGTQDTTSGTTSITLLPQGKTGDNETDSGWITRQTQDASVTGDFDFATAGGMIVYHVKNVTVNAQAVAKPGQTTTYPYSYGQAWTTATPTAASN